MDWTDLAQGEEHVAGQRKHGEPLGLIKCGEFVGLTRNYRLLKKDSTPCS